MRSRCSRGGTGLTATDQTQDIFRRFDAELREMDLSLENTVRTRLWGRDRESRDLGSRERVKVLSGKAAEGGPSKDLQHQLGRGAPGLVRAVRRPRRYQREAERDLDAGFHAGGARAVHHPTRASRLHGRADRGVGLARSCGRGSGQQFVLADSPAVAGASSRLHVLMARSASAISECGRTQGEDARGATIDTLGPIARAAARGPSARTGGGGPR